MMRVPCRTGFDERHRTVVTFRYGISAHEVARALREVHKMLNTLLQTAPVLRFIITGDRVQKDLKS